MRNPKWARDELILALNLYFALEYGDMDDEHPKVIALSEVLNGLRIHLDRPDVERFRNPNGVAMKLNNFKAFDPDYQGSGLTRGGKLDKEIWDEYSGDRNRLKTVAEAITSNAITTTKEFPEELIDESEEFREGKVLTRTHKVRERNRSAAKRKKASVLNSEGRLCCAVCGFDFNEVYGEIGHGFIECHHTVPLSGLGDIHTTKLSDLELVCANCHRMLHRANLDVSELKKHTTPP